MSLDLLYFAVSWVLLRWHDLLALVGLPGRSGLIWAAAIALLVLTIRLCLLPLVIRQTHAQRRLEQLQPQLAAIRQRHPKDLAAQQAAMAELGAPNALSGCLPLLAQWPIFLALLQVLRHLANSATAASAFVTGHPTNRHQLSLYGFTPTQTADAARAKVFGAPLSASLHRGRGFVHDTLGGSLTATHVAIAVVVLVSATAVFLSQRLARSVTPVEGANAAVTRAMAWLVPVSVLGSGLFFPLGLLWYWCVSNLVTLAQQLYLNRYHPPVTAPARPPAHPSRSVPAAPTPARRSRASGRTR